MSDPLGFFSPGWLGEKRKDYIPSLKLTAKAPKNGWLEVGIPNVPIGEVTFFRG